MNFVTPAQVAQCTGSSLSTAGVYTYDLSKSMAEFGIHTPAQQAAFLAQIGHETMNLRYLYELWGPTPAQVKYEGREDLGNTQPGDGKLFKGRGMFQLTGRANYAGFRDRMRERFPTMNVPDFVFSPDLLTQSFWASVSAAEFWFNRNLNSYADSGDFVGLTKRINGGTNGLAARQALWAKAKSALRV